MESNPPALMLRSYLESLHCQLHGDDLTKRFRSWYFAVIYVDGKEVIRTSPKKLDSQNSTQVLVGSWKWSGKNEIHFGPSSAIRIVLLRGLSLAQNITTFHREVGRFEGMLTDVLLNEDAPLELKDTRRDPIRGIVMNINLTPLECQLMNDVVEFIGQVEADLLLLKERDDNTARTKSALGELLTFMMRITSGWERRVRLLDIAWIFHVGLYLTLSDYDLDHYAILSLISTLRSLFFIGSSVLVDLVNFHDEKSIEEISRLAIDAALLVYEYTKLPWAGRTVRVQMPRDLRSRMEECEKCCSDIQYNLHDAFLSR